MNSDKSSVGVTPTLIVCLSCLARRMPDGMVFINQEELDELEYDKDYNGNLSISYANDGIEISYI